MKEKSVLSTSLKLEDWEIDAETVRETYSQGKNLIGRFGKADPKDPFALGSLSEHLSNDQLKAYVSAWDHDERKRQNKLCETARLLAQSMVDCGLLSRVELAPHRTEHVSCENDATLQEAIVRFLARGQRAPSTIRSYEQKLSLFSNIIKELMKGKEPRISQISSEMIRQYSDYVHRLSKRIQLVSGKPVSEALVAPGAGISAKTIACHLSPNGNRYIAERLVQILKNEQPQALLGSRMN